MNTEQTNMLRQALADLLDEYRDLDSRIIRTRAISYREKVSGGGAQDSKPPLPVEVVDRMTTIESFTARAYRIAHRVLELAPPAQDRRKTLRTQRQLAWIANALATLADRSTNVVDSLADDLWTMIHATSTAGRAAFRIAGECPICGMGSLWADPVSNLVACGVPECGSRWTAQGFVSELASV